MQDAVLDCLAENLLTDPAYEDVAEPLTEEEAAVAAMTEVMDELPIFVYQA